MYSTVPEKVEGKNKIKMTLAKTLNNKRQFIKLSLPPFSSLRKIVKGKQIYSIKLLLSIIFTAGNL